MTWRRFMIVALFGIAQAPTPPSTSLLDPDGEHGSPVVIRTRGH